MIQKIQTLQKRLITKTEEVVEKELLIQVRIFSIDSDKCVMRGFVCDSWFRVHACVRVFAWKRSGKDPPIESY